MKFRSRVDAVTEILEENGIHRVDPLIRHFAKVNGFSIDSVERKVDEIIRDKEAEGVYVTAEEAIEALEKAVALDRGLAEYKAEKARRAGAKEKKCVQKKWGYPKALREKLQIDPNRLSAE